MYESFYKLKGKPFNLSPDPDFFYRSSGHKRVLAYLRYGINQAEGFIVVTGEIGTGKTTLVRTLLNELASDHSIIAAHLVTTQLEADDLLRMVAASFGLTNISTKKAEMLDQIERFLKSKAQNNVRALLIVDEAQNLPDHSLEELRMLSNHQLGNKPLLQSFLVGQAEFRETLRSEHLEQFSQRVIASYHLGPMDLEETKGYIEHRLSIVGWKHDPEFTAEAHSAIFGFTEGVPRKINTFCDRIMLYSYLEESHQITLETVRKVLDELHSESHVASAPTSTQAPIGEQIAPMQDAPTAFSPAPGEANTSLAQLERRVQRLEDVLAKSQALLKALLAEPK